MKAFAITALLASALGSASAATIDFNAVPLGTVSSVVTNGVTFTYLGGDGLFDVESASPGGPISGRALISFRRNPGADNFRASTASGFSSFSIGCGDFGGDDDNCILEAYDAFDNLLDSDAFAIPANSSIGGTLSVSSSTPIAYVLFREVGTFAGAIYWDNVTFERAGNAVPEPAALGLALLALGGAAAARRRRA